MHGREVEALEAPGLVDSVAAAAVSASDIEHGPQHLAVDASDLAVQALGYRESGNAPLESVELDLHGLNGRRVLLLLLLGEAARLRIERRLAARLQRDEVGTPTARERQVEVHAVVHRVEGAHRQEIEIASLRVERGAVVPELPIGHGHDAAAAELIKVDGALTRDSAEGVGEPGAVG